MTGMRSHADDLDKLIERSILTHDEHTVPRGKKTWPAKLDIPLLHLQHVLNHVFADRCSTLKNTFKESKTSNL